MRLAVEGVPRTSKLVTIDQATSGIGFVRQLENMVTAVAGLPTALDTQRAQARKTLAEVEGQLGVPFKGAAELAAARAALASIDARLIPPSDQQAPATQETTQANTTTHTQQPPTVGLRPGGRASDRGLTMAHPADPREATPGLGR